MTKLYSNVLHNSKHKVSQSILFKNELNHYQLEIHRFKFQAKFDKIIEN